jgi:hypothetical protein
MSKFRIEVECEFESDLDYRKECEPDDVTWIESELENGNTWAWCTVRVSLVFPYFNIKVDEYLGCCSYIDKESFLECGYYEDMVNTNKQKIKDAYESIC